MDADPGLLLMQVAAHYFPLQFVELHGMRTLDQLGHCYTMQNLESSLEPSKWNQNASDKIVVVENVKKTSFERDAD